MTINLINGALITEIAKAERPVFLVFAIVTLLAFSWGKQQLDKTVSYHREQSDAQITNLIRYHEEYREESKERERLTQSHLAKSNEIQAQTAQALKDVMQVQNETVEAIRDMDERLKNTNDALDQKLEHFSNRLIKIEKRGDKNVV